MFDFMLWPGYVCVLLALAALIASFYVKGRDGKPRQDLRIGGVWMLVIGVAILGLWALEVTAPLSR